MMSEKRKIQRFNLDEGRIWEAIEGLSPFKTTYTLEEVCEKLNEQQELIEELQVSDEMGWKRAEKFEKELKQKKIYIKRLEYKVQKFKEMNGEQQDTIRKLQDLCGESDSENARLRLKSKELQEEIKLLKPTNIEQYEQIQKLQEENEQLQAQLREKEEDEQLYANEIVKLNKEAKEVLDFKSLGGDY